MQGPGRSGPTSTAALARSPAARLGALRLSRRAKRGDRGAFEEIFRRHHQELYRYCLAIVGDRDDAEDALQATMAAALRSIPGETRRIDIRPWLFRVAHNESVTILRRRREAGEIDDDLLDGASISQEDELATRERLRALVGDLGELPDRQRSAIVMRELSGLSYAEIGGALSCSESAARQAVYEARTALREREEGRSMECEQIRRAISERDGRRLRGRRVKAHLAGCDGCRGFAASITQRHRDLRVLFPPLPAAAAGAMLSGLVGGGSGGAAALGGAAAGGGIAASAAVKGASLAAAVAIAAGAAEVGGLIELPNPVGAGSKPAAEQEGSAAVAAPTSGDASRGGAASGRAGGGPALAHSHRSKGGDGGRDRGPRHGQGGGAQGGGGSAASGGGSAAATTPAPAAPAGSAAGGNGNGGRSSSAPGQTGSNPGGGTATAPGQTGSSPGGGTATAPGQTGAAGNSGSAPGHTGSTPAASGTAGSKGQGHSSK